MPLKSSEIKPSRILQDHVESYWWVVSNLPHERVSSPHTCIPKGTVELIIQMEGTVSEVLTGGKWQPLENEVLVGIHSTPVTWRMRGPGCKMGIRLKPEAFIEMFDVPLASLYQKSIPLVALTGSRLNWLFQMLRNAPDMDSRIGIIESFLCKKLTALKTADQHITRALRKIWHEEGNISTASLSRSVYIGERQLQRLFKNQVGISPKLYSRIVRFRSAYQQAKSGRQVDWTDVAYSLGYADQAHLVKDFKNFAGVTPTALFN